MTLRSRIVWLGLIFVAAIGLAVTVLAPTRRAGDDEPVPVPHEVGEPRIRVEVLNGSGRAGLAREATRRLRDHGFDVVFYGNASSFDQETSAVIARLGDLDAASDIAGVLGIDAVSDEPDATRLLDVTVILGLDWPPPDP